MIPLFTRLVIDDLLGGSTPPPTVDPTTVITGLFREIMRQDPTPDELQSYSALWNITGINGVVAGLYSSTAFRRNQVETYYLEQLGRNATEHELSWGASGLIWGVPEPVFAAAIAASSEFYASSNAGGGPDGATPQRCRSSTCSIAPLWERRRTPRSPRTTCNRYRPGSRPDWFLCSSSPPNHSDRSRS